MKSENGGEFVNNLFETFCVNNGINHNFSTPRTPQKMVLLRRKIVFEMSWEGH